MLEKFTKLINKSETDFTAERAWVETTYGKDAWRPIEKRIAEKQKQIKETIKGKFLYSSGGGNTISLKSYRCVIDFEEDLKNNIDEILKPFYDGGFDIINLSERIPEIYDENVYLISWRHIFDKNMNNSKTNILQSEADERMICS
ncbi:MAG: hypothetical protein J1F35_08185 [Erysipelotrichales bacterium]|nr:hypothetical protein [Erysipelotrichales bacterium]